jgi:hypothetical protein
VSDYLFDKSGKPDADVEELEKKLAPLRYRPRTFDAASAAAAAADAATGAARASHDHTVRLATKRRRRNAGVAVALLAAAAAALIHVRSRPPREVATVQRIGPPPQAPWRDVEARLRAGEWLETGPAAEARVAISDIGQLDIAPSTRLRLVEDTPTRQRIELARGKIHAKVNAPPEIFVVQTPVTKAVDLGCEYTLDVDERGNGELSVRSGWVALEGASRWAYVPAGARSPMRHDLGPGVPRYDDAPETLRHALARIEAGEAVPESLAVVLRDARRKDSLTLYHLLHRVDATARKQVYQRLAMLAPPPRGVDEPRVLRLDRPALEAWGAQMAITW